MVIKDKATLSIRAGITVKFNAGTGLHIDYGSLQAVGTAEAPIVFTSVSGASDGWRGIFFDDWSDYGSSSSLTYCIIENAGQANARSISAAIHSYNTETPFMNNCIIRKNGGHGVYLERSKPSLSGRNIFLGFTLNDGRYAVYNNSSNEILARDNYWGTADSGGISRQIFDKADDPSKGPVLFTPFLTASDLIPAVPSLLAPADGATVDTTTPLLRWSVSEGGLFYTVEIAKDSGFTQLIIAEPDLATTSHIVPADQLGDNKTYYWRVRAENLVERSAWASARFTVVLGPSTQFPLWDVNQDGIVDILDLVLVGIHFGEDYRLQAPLDALVGTVRTTHAEGTLFLSVSGKVDLEWLLPVEIKVTPVADLYGYQFDIVFDSSALEVLTITPSSLLKQDNAQTYWNIGQIDNNLGRIRGITHVRQATKTGVTANGILATVVFKVKASSTSKLGHIRFDNVKLADSQARIIQVNTRSALLNWQQLLTPAKFALLQNYPNPFNPETWIPFELANPAEVTVRIYNLKGQLIRTLHLGSHEAGSYLTKDRAAYWNGRDNIGQKVSSGIYFYTIQAGNFTATRKMILMK